MSLLIKLDLFTQQWKHTLFKLHTKLTGNFSVSVSEFHRSAAPNNSEEEEYSTLQHGHMALWSAERCRATEAEMGGAIGAEIGGLKERSSLIKGDYPNSF